MEKHRRVGDALAALRDALRDGGIVGLRERLQTESAALLEMVGHPISEVPTDRADTIVLRSEIGDRSICLEVADWPSSDPPQEPSPRSVRTITIQTNLDDFRTYRGVGAGRRPFLSTASRECLLEELALVGSLWQSLFPEHRAILTRTLALTVDMDCKGTLFAARPPAVRRSADRKAARLLESEAVARLRTAFCSGQSELRPLNELVRRLAPQSGTTEILRGQLVLRRYQIPRSGAFDFGTPEVSPSRRDYVISYRGPAGTIYERDFHLGPAEPEQLSDAHHRAELDALHVLALRRSGLFRLGFGRRVYNVILPSAVLARSGSSDGLVVIPCLTLYREPSKSSFRRTFTLSFMAIPTALDDEDHAVKVRKSRMEDLWAIQSDLKLPFHDPGLGAKAGSWSATGPLARELGVLGAETTIPEFMEAIAKWVLEAALEADSAAAAASLVVTAGIESRIGTMILQTEWDTRDGNAHPWEDWMVDPKTAPVVHDNLFKLFFHDDYVAPGSGYTTGRNVRLEDMHVGNTLGVDMSGMTFFDPTSDMKLMVFPIGREQYPNYSIVRWTAYALFTDSALSALQGMIHRFYWDLEASGDLRAVLRSQEEMIASFAELYDLDIRLYFYRAEYEKLRHLLRLDHDYELLLAKFDTIKDSASLTEQRLVNKLVLGFTVATVTTGIVAALGSVDRWSGVRLVTVSAVLSITLTLVAYLLFDPIRRLLFGNSREDR